MSAFPFLIALHDHSEGALERFALVAAGAGSWFTPVLAFLGISGP